MPDWDANSPKLQQNLINTLRAVRDHTVSRNTPGINDAKTWHTSIMAGLRVPEQRFVGKFRGEQGLQDIGVRIGEHQGVSPAEVLTELSHFEQRLRRVLERLDELIPAGQLPGANTLKAVLDVCGWVHAEWVRIHPFANGNGRIARLWANYVAMRYGLPPFVQLRPRPDGIAYANAGTQAMMGNWEPTAQLFNKMLASFHDDRGDT
ncbi:MAG: hypothetical protein GXP14_12375 [Gammaproteobacteria bacterium]|nr:hypothetical protein [Gammaproteobacteria bacterium]